MWIHTLARVAVATLLAVSALAEIEDAGPLMVGPNEVGGVLCSARNADDADQTISIVATDETGGMVGTAAAANVVPGAERQLVLPFGAVSQRSITCRSEGEAAISSSISVKERTGRVVEALRGMGPAPAVVKDDAGMNTSAGTGALENNTTGMSNTAFGFDALMQNTVGSRNTAVGKEALKASTGGGGGENTAVGYRALHSSEGQRNTAVGVNALVNNIDGRSNTAVGEHSLRSNTTGIRNTAVGGGAMFFSKDGNSNTAIGYEALVTAVSGDSNVALGLSALRFSQSGAENVAVGREAGLRVLADANTLIGHQAGAEIITGTKNIQIGHQVGNTTGNESATIRIGVVDPLGPDDQTRNFQAGIFGATVGVSGVGVVVDMNGQLGTASSSRTVKKDIEPMALASAPLHALRPVSFRYKEHAADTPVQYGFVAEEVAEVMPELVIRDAEGQPTALRWHLIHALLVNEVQKQQETITALTERLERLEAQASVPIAQR